MKHSILLVTCLFLFSSNVFAEEGTKKEIKPEEIEKKDPPKSETAEIAKTEKVVPSGGEITIPIENLRNTSKGKLWIMLYKKVNRVDADLNKAWKKQSLNVNSAKLEAKFKNIPFGDYAVAVIHDLDSDKELTTNWIGIPREDICISNNVKGGPFGGPKWKDAKFSHKAQNTKVSTLQMVHMWKD